MTSITLHVTGARAVASVSGPLTSGMVGIPVTVEYDGVWNGLTKNLVCRCGRWESDKGETRMVVGIEQTAVVAPEVMQADRYLYLGIEGYSADGKLVIPTTWAYCGKIRYGADGGADPSADPNLPVWAQMQAEIEQLKQNTLTEEQIADAVAAYLEENPIDDSDSSQDAQETSIFAGKTASFYGDSLTEKNGHYTKGYHEWVRDILGLASYNNYGVSGFKVRDVYSSVANSTDSPDLVFVMCGVNDQTFSVPLGAMGDATLDTTYGALNLLCASLKQKYPTAVTVFITPHYQTKYPHSEGITSYEVSRAVREVCEKYAIPVYDNYSLSGIYETNLSVFTTDNCHWNDTAHEMVGKNLARFVSDTFRYVYGASESGKEEIVSVTGVTLNATAGILNEGDTVTLTATVSPEDAADKSVSWKSSDTGVATVSGGVVTAVSAGNAIITVTTNDGGYTDTYAVRVETSEEETVAVTGVALSAESGTLTEGDTVTLNVTITPTNATNKLISWKSSNESVATVLGGVVTAVSAGNAIITVTTNDGGYTDTYTVKVEAAEEETVAVTGVALNAASGTLTEGDTVTLTATVSPADAANKNVSWKSSDTGVATVSGGVVTAVSAGDATITVTTEDGGFTAAYALTVEAAIAPLTVNATIKKAEMNSVTYLMFLMERPAGTDTVLMSVELDIDNTEKFKSTGLSGPFYYESVDGFNSADKKGYGGGVTATITGNHIVIKGYSSTSEYPYQALLFALDAATVPFDVTLTNVVGYVDDVQTPVLAVGTYTSNTDQSVADITIQ